MSNTSLHTTLCQQPVKRRVLVGLGANQGHPALTFGKALRALSGPLGHPVAVSSFYESGALTLDGQPQENYLNAVAQFESSMPATAILHVLLETERSLGRDRTHEPRWGPRLIDLDLLFVENELLEDDSCTVPHPELHKRDFVLVPLAEILPEFTHPKLNQSAAELERSLEERGYDRFIMRRWCVEKDDLVTEQISEGTV